MEVPFVDLKAQYQTIREDIDGAIRSILDGANFVGGKPVKDFESAFAAAYGVKHVIGVANGTDAIYITMKMLGIGAGDEVITTATSWISTSETISQTGARVVFADIDPVTYTIDPAQIEKLITPRTRAVIPVHLYGQSCHMEEISRICKKHNLHLIEDCAQSHFTAEGNKLAGTWGIAGTLSFYPGKNLGAYGDAGCIVTNDDELARKMRMYANHGALVKHAHEIEGINSRLDTLQAAILGVKLKHIQQWTRQRIGHAAAYNKLLSGIGDLQVPLTRPGTTHTFHLYVIRTKQREALKAHLERAGIHTAIHYPTALPNLPAYRYLGHTPADFPVATEHQSLILSLPMFPELTQEQIAYTADNIRAFFQK